MLDLSDRLEFERLLQWLRLGFLTAPVLVLVAFGRPAAPYAALILAVVLCSYAWVALLLQRFPAALLRYQLILRLLDCTLVLLVLVNYHRFLHNAYYDFVYTLFIVAATATHGQRGGLLLAPAAGSAVLLGRLYNIWRGSFPFEVRHLTDSVFYTIFFLITALAVAFLMRRSGEVVARRERLWRAELAARNRILEQTAAARDRALAEAQEAIRVRDDVLAFVSHDLKNPLTAIKAMGQLLQLHAARGGTIAADSLKTPAAAIQRAATQMAGQLQDLLDVARRHAGQPLPLHLAPADLVTLVRQVAAYQQIIAGHQIRIETAAAALTGEWDAVRLERVIDNLLANAIKYSPGGSEITVTLARHEDAAGAWAVLTVRDQGLGIPAADLPHIFDRFYRAGNVAGRVAGSGIGLTAVREIVEQHGGTVSVQSREGMGSTFTVRLPLPATPSSGPGTSTGSCAGRASASARRFP